VFGRSQGSAVIDNIQTEQYRFKTASRDVPIFSYKKVVAGRQMPFELVSTGFKGTEELYEEPPIPGNQVGFVYRNDGKGGTSANTGFFMMFKQGSLELADFNISVPTTNELIAVDTNNINNDDVWLYALSSTGVQLDPWTKVSSLIGNNILGRITLNAFPDTLITNNNSDRILKKREYYGPVRIRQLEVSLTNKYGKLINML
jgi:hypothetical protein